MGSLINQSRLFCIFTVFTLHFTIFSEMGSSDVLVDHDDARVMSASAADNKTADELRNFQKISPVSIDVQDESSEEQKNKQTKKPDREEALVEENARSFEKKRSLDDYLEAKATFEEEKGESTQKQEKNQADNTTGTRSVEENVSNAEDGASNTKNGSKADESIEKKSKKASKKDNNKEDASNQEGEEEEESKPKKPKREPIVYPFGDSEIRAWIKLRMPEMFYGKNIELLNDKNCEDRTIFARHVIDLKTEYRFFNPILKYDIVVARVNIRDKGIWGDPKTIATTTPASIDLLGAKTGRHSHDIPRHIFWIRELWIQLSLKDFLGFPFEGYPTVTFGAFPFELGRGISLGSAFTVDPTDLGFYSEAAVDQYAFGAKLSAQLCEKSLEYDFYVGILNNKSHKFGLTCEKIRLQERGHRFDPFRGFGIINYILAGRVRATPVKRECAKVCFEPYMLFLRDPEQRVEFLGDADAKMATFGLANENAVGNFEWGFDLAFNVGRQHVKAWDRNMLKIENRDGLVAIVNSQVHQDFDPGNNPDPSDFPLALNVKVNKEIINESAHLTIENCQVIGENELGALINSCERFTDPYINTLGGSMMVVDAGYYIKKPEILVCIGGGYASGDRNPNRDIEKLGDTHMDGHYGGFIGIQEVYSGTRIKSAYLLSGSGRIPRITAFPSLRQSTPEGQSVSRFSNIIFFGASTKHIISLGDRLIELNPNLLAYWQDDSCNIHDPEFLNLNNKHFADPFLGVEVNLFAEMLLIDGLRCFGVFAAFAPGKHFEDIKGRPLNKDQKEFLDQIKKTGRRRGRMPLLGNDDSFFLNLGIEYTF